MAKDIGAPGRSEMRNAGKAAARPMERSSGCCRLAFKLRDGASVVDRLYQAGCCQARFGATNEAILINTAGGLTGGDHVQWSVRARSRTTVTVTTQAWEKIYRSAGDGPARVETTIRVEAGASLLWTPQETILFDGGDLARNMEADVAASGEFLCLEAIAFGRKAMGENIAKARLADRRRIRREGELIHADDLRLDGDIGQLLKRPAVARGGLAAATLVYVSQGCDAKLDALRAAIGTAGGASAFGGKLLARMVAEDSYALRKVIGPALACLAGGQALPKIWTM